MVKTTTDLSEAADLVSEFTKLNPGVAVEYSKVLSTDLFDEVVKSSGKKGTVDVVWSSSMDLQIKLADDGHAAEYRSAEAEGIFGWARWKDRAYGVTAEPVVIVFNKRLLREDLVPKDREELVRLLTDHLPVFQGKIATYDPELSGTGLLFITQDVRVTTQTWKLVAAMGRANVKLYSSSGPMIDRVSAGDLVLAYNVLGTYALERAKQTRISASSSRAITLYCCRGLRLSHNPRQSRSWPGVSSISCCRATVRRCWPGIRWDRFATI